MSQNLFMLDSGAFSVWNKGAEVDLDEYIRFCLKYDQCSYFVALDKIPGRPNNPRSLTPEAIQHACQVSWDNYQKMLTSLPIEKVIPVFHMGDSWDWLERYLDFGTPYIGISPANDKTTEQKMAWLREVIPRIFSSDGKPLIKTHGFAVTSFRLMKAMQWFSVDSASWLKQATYGTVYVPFPRQRHEYRYDVSPQLINVSPRSPSNNDFGAHWTNLTPLVKQRVSDYFESINVKIGEFEIVDVDEGYKRDSSIEIWYTKKRTQVVRTVEDGVSTCFKRRMRVNALFLKRANEVLPVDNIFFAAGETVSDDRIERNLQRRLMSFHALCGAKEESKAMINFKGWLERV